MALTAEELFAQAENYYKFCSYTQSTPLYEEAARLGHGEAQARLGLAYKNGWAVEKDLAAAAFWFWKAAEQGVISAEYNLAQAFEGGLGVKKDLKAAAYYYASAAKKGNPGAAFALSKIKGKVGVLPENYLPDFSIFSAFGADVAPMVETNDETAEGGEGKFVLFDGEKYEVEDLYAEARGYYDDEEYDEAFDRFEALAEAGYAEAQNDFAECFAFGFGTVPDSAAAKFWYEKAAAQNHAWATYALGAMYERGDGVARNPMKAIELYKQAENLGSAEAAQRLQELGR